jgi:transaldolase
MKIYLASATLDDIRWAVSHGLVDGVITTPALIGAVTGTPDDHELLAEICRATALPVAASVASVHGADIYRDGRELAKISDQIVVQVPLVEDAITAMCRLSSEGVRVTATLVFNAAQALLAAKAGASTVSTSIDQLDALGQDSSSVVRQLRAVFDAGRVECEVTASLPQSSAQVAICATAGADSVAVTATTLRSLLLHPLTDRGLDQFLNDLSRHQKPRKSP